MNGYTLGKKIIHWAQHFFLLCEKRLKEKKKKKEKNVENFSESLDQFAGRK